MDEVIGRIDKISNGKLQVLSDMYINSKTKLLLKCSCGKLFKRDFEHISRGQIMCDECIKNFMSEFNRLSIDYVKDYIHNHGCEYISGEYKNNNSKLTIRCRCGKIFDKSFGKFMSGQDRCPECGKLMEVGENHYNYKGGISSLNLMIRTKLHKWRDSILKIYNYTCPITGEKDDICIHHLTSFDTILKNVLSEHDMDINTYQTSLRSIDMDKFNNIVNDILERHTLYDGIPLYKDVHKVFHSKYGFGNNSPQQFDEFLKNHYSINLSDIQSVIKM